MDRFLSKPPSFDNKRKLVASASSSSAKKVATSCSFKKGEQMYLDIGQKFGVSKNCSKCGMLLVVSDLDDIKRHSKFCKEAAKAPTLPTLTGHTVRSKFNQDSEYIIEVKTDQKHHSKVIQAVLDIVMNELGCSSDFLSEAKTAYMYVKNDLSIVGCLVADEIPLSCTTTLHSADDVSRLLSPVNSENNQLNNNINTTTTTTTDSVESECGRKTLGVRLIWVSHTARREGIASRLVDCARQFIMYGTVVHRDSVAFSQPTKEGYDFATAYCQSSSVLGY